jgi:hypothetical protein
MPRNASTSASQTDRPHNGRPISPRQARQGGQGRHIFWILLISTLATALALFGYWAISSDDLSRAEQTATPTQVAVPAAGESPAAP